MLKQRYVGSKLIDFDKSTTDNRIAEVADALIDDLLINKKHLEKKRGILISLLVNLTLNNRCGYSTAISRSKNYYSKALKRYQHKYFSYKIVTEILDKLIQNKYVQLIKKGEKYVFGEVSTYSPTDELNFFTKSLTPDNISFINDELIILRKKIPKKYKLSKKLTPEEKELNNEELISIGLLDVGQITKDHKKFLVDYDDTDYTRKIREDLKEYNLFRSQHSISLMNLPQRMFKIKKYYDSIKKFIATDIKKIKPDSNGFYQIPILKDQLYRIFSEDFEHGGRFYRGFETQLRKELRPFIAINGNPTAELDFGSYHIRMIYHLENKRSPEDPYVVFEEMEEEVRDYYKLMVATCLNCSSIKSVLNALRHYIIKEDLVDEFSSLKNDRLKQGLDDLIKHNKKVAHHFFKGEGMIYQKIDSDIANDILMYFTHRNPPILVLNVHDSFLIEKQHEEELRWAMNKFYRAKFRKLPKIK